MHAKVFAGIFSRIKFALFYEFKHHQFWVKIFNIYNWTFLSNRVMVIWDKLQIVSYQQRKSSSFTTWYDVNLPSPDCGAVGISDTPEWAQKGDLLCPAPSGPRPNILNYSTVIKTFTMFILVENWEVWNTATPLDRQRVNYWLQYGSSVHLIGVQTITHICFNHNTCWFITWYHMTALQWQCLHCLSTKHQLNGWWCVMLAVGKVRQSWTGCVRPGLTPVIMSSLWSHSAVTTVTPVTMRHWTLSRLSKISYR